MYSHIQNSFQILLRNLALIMIIPIYYIIIQLDIIDGYIRYKLYPVRAFRTTEQII